MLNLFGKHIGPIGVDLGSGFLRMAQIAQNGNGPYLHCAAVAARPETVVPQSPAWQRWAVESMKELSRSQPFKGKKIVTALPSDDLFIDQIRIPRSQMEKLDEAVASRIQKKMPFPPQEGLIRSVPVHIEEQKNPEVEVIVMGAAREKVHQHLAIFEAAGLEIASIGVWPQAMINSYRHFFCRRTNDQNRVVMLMDIGTNHCNVVICRGSNLLFARVIPTGFIQLSQGQLVQRLFAEIDACCRYHETMLPGVPIERILLLAGKNVDKCICEKVSELAQKMQTPAQIGDVLSAIDVGASNETIDRRNTNIDWAMAFGLSLENAPK